MSHLNVHPQESRHPSGSRSGRRSSSASQRSDTQVQQLAQFASDIRFESVSEDAREQLKLRVLAALGRALGALDAKPVRIVLEHVNELGLREVFEANKGFAVAAKFDRLVERRIEAGGCNQITRAVGDLEQMTAPQIAESLAGPLTGASR